MDPLHPRTSEELAAMLADHATQGRTIGLSGAGTKERMAGPVEPAYAKVSTRCLRRILQYDPGDLTISLEAGLPWAELSQALAENRQMIPLDPPFAASATVGGVVAANTCGPRRRLYGTARDVVIGMKFATLEGKLVSSGGMVVKNVAGLDMAKIMIGSFGTLAAIAVVNFKVTPIPQVTRTFAFNFDSAAEAIAVRDRIIRSVLQPAAVDVLNPQASARVGLTGFAVLIDAGGSPAVLERYSGELAEARTVDGEQVWPAVREFTPEWLSENLNGSVVRVSSTLGALGEVLDSTQAPVVARAASGVAYAHFVEPASAVTWMHSCAARGWRTVMEYGPSARAGLPLWPAVGDDFAIMERVKQMFDPSHLLNRGRLYGRI